MKLHTTCCRLNLLVLLKVQNDIIVSMDRGKVTALTLQDLAAAFDTIDHAKLTDRLSNWYGISGKAQIWFSSYLKKIVIYP